MDPTALRLEKIKLALGQAQDDAQFFGRLYVALAAVTVAAVFSVAGAAIAGQVPWAHAVLLEALLLNLRHGFGPADAAPRGGAAERVCPDLPAHRYVDAGGG